ncbi:MAG: hypothetical protein GY866_22885 [Proteobacteria bacterium]|nr:hypothetical protein [Pseudomonadota bacterium]
MIEENGKKNQIAEKQYIGKVESILKRTSNLKSLNPASPGFLGKSIQYPVKKKKRIFRIRKAPDINGLRDAVVQTSEAKVAYETRKTLNTLLKRHPFDPNLRVMKGIQLLNDTHQSGLNGKRLDVLKTAVVETAIAVHNNGFSLFNATWLIKIYLKYLETLHRRAVNEYQIIRANFHWQIRNAVDEVHVLILQMTSLLGLKKHMTGLTLLNAKLKGSAYMYDCISKEEMTEAGHLMLKGEASLLESGKTANYVIWVSITLGSLFARIPIMHKMATEILTAVPDVSLDLTLQKKMIGTIAKVAEYQMAQAEGDSRLMESSAVNLYQRCHDIIKQDLNGIITYKKTYEIDPYLKAAWIAKELRGLIEATAYRKMLYESLELLNIVISKTEDVKDSIEMATRLRLDIEEIMLSYGWSPFEMQEN